MSQVERGHGVKQNVTSQKQGQSGRRARRRSDFAKKASRGRSCTALSRAAGPGGRHVSTVLGGVAVTGQKDKHKDMWLQGPRGAGREGKGRRRSAHVRPEPPAEKTQRSAAEGTGDGDGLREDIRADGCGQHRGSGVKRRVVNSSRCRGDSGEGDPGFAGQ